MTLKITIIIIIGLAVNAFFSHSFYGRKMEQSKIENEFVTALLKDAGILSPNKRILEFFFDLCLINFAYNFEWIFRNGILESIQQNLLYIYASLVIFSPFENNSYLPVFIKALISIFVLVYPFVFIEMLGEHARHDVNSSRFSILLIPFLILVNYLIFAVTNLFFGFIGGFSQSTVINLFIEAFVLIFIVTVYIEILLEFHDS